MRERKRQINRKIETERARKTYRKRERERKLALHQILSTRGVLLSIFHSSKNIKCLSNSTNVCFSVYFFLTTSLSLSLRVSNLAHFLLETLAVNYKIIQINRKTSKIKYKMHCNNSRNDYFLRIDFLFIFYQLVILLQ